MSAFPKRKPTRLKEYDYSAPGAYFVTVCAKDKAPLYGRIVGGGDFDAPQNILSAYGNIVDNHIHQLHNFYPHISVDKYVVMPNHIHLLLAVAETINGTSGTPSPTNSVIAKFVSTLKRFCNRDCGKNIFQRSYHDHIIRCEKDYQKIRNYIDTNVFKWEQDCFYMHIE